MFRQMLTQKVWPLSKWRRTGRQIMTHPQNLLAWLPIGSDTGAAGAAITHKLLNGHPKARSLHACGSSPTLS
jgi:hypothetical protein